MKPFIIGEAPGRTGDPLRPLGGTVGMKLLTWAGLVPDGADGDCYDVLRDRFVPLNLVQYWPGLRGADSSTGAAFPAEEAAVAWSQFTGRKRGRVAVLLGARVARIAGVHKVPWREWTTASGLTVTAVPHPSGLTRAYNDQSERDATGAVLLEALMRSGGSRC